MLYFKGYSYSHPAHTRVCSAEGGASKSGCHAHETVPCLCTYRHTWCVWSLQLNSHSLPTLNVWHEGAGAPAVLTWKIVCESCVLIPYSRGYSHKQQNRLWPKTYKLEPFCLHLLLKISTACLILHIVEKWYFGSYQINGILLQHFPQSSTSPKLKSVPLI